MENLIKLYFQLKTVYTNGVNTIYLSDVIHALAAYINMYQINKLNLLEQGEKGDPNMNQEQFNQLVRIYNTLLTVNTKGEDTLVMSDCIRALKQSIESIQVIEEPKTDSAE